MTLHAVILTGSRDSHNPLLAGTGLHSKALLPIVEKPMLAYVLRAIAGSRFQPEINVSTSDPAVAGLKMGIPFKTWPSEDQAVSSLLKSLERLPNAEWVLFVSGDHPLLTSEMIDYFVAEVMRRDLTFGVAAVSRSEVNRYYPQSRRTYFEAKGDAYSGGNLFLVNRRKFHGSVAFMEMIDRNRKKPWKNLLRLNPITALRILLRLADIHEVAKAASGVFGCKTGIVEMPFAECCMDVDKPSDRDIAETILRRRQENPQAGEQMAEISQSAVLRVANAD